MLRKVSEVFIVSTAILAWVGSVEAVAAGVPGSVVASNVGGRIYIGEAKALGLAGAVLGLIRSLASYIVTSTSPWIEVLLVLVEIIAVLLVYLGVSRLSRAVNNTRIKRFYLIFFIIYTVTDIIWVSLVATELMPPILVFEVIAVLFAIGTWYLKKSYDLIKAYTRVRFFGVAGLLYFVSGVLMIIFIGTIILPIAVIIEVTAWASTPKYIEVKGEATPQPLPQIA